MHPSSPWRMCIDFPTALVRNPFETCQGTSLPYSGASRNFETCFSEMVKFIQEGGWQNFVYAEMAEYVDIRGSRDWFCMKKSLSFSLWDYFGTVSPMTRW